MEEWERELLEAWEESRWWKQQDGDCNHPYAVIVNGMKYLDIVREETPIFYQTVLNQFLVKD